MRRFFVSLLNKTMIGTLSKLMVDFDQVSNLWQLGIVNE